MTCVICGRPFGPGEAIANGLNGLIHATGCPSWYAPQPQPPPTSYTIAGGRLTPDNGVVEPTNLIDRLKQQANDTDQATRQALYVWLYDVHGCRRW